ncbi:MAG: HmuY family protein [Treponema sp.]|jgi:hypothetical protein|nr:HmuY family protein [Treponema sp.]
MFFFKPEPRGTGRRDGIKAGRSVIRPALAILTVLALITVSCNDSGGAGVVSGINPVYKTAVARVDYSGANRAVFFDFSTGKTTELAHDFFDIAIDAGSNIIANSGSYGSGVQVYKTAEPGANIGNDFSSLETSVKEYTFRSGVTLYQVQGGGSLYQTTENPLGTMPAPMPPGTKSNVYLVKVQYGSAPAEYFKVVFQMNMSSPPMSYKMEVVPGLGSGTTNQVVPEGLVGGLTDGYGWLYFKLVGGTPRVLNNGTTWLGTGADAAAAPLSANWDILCTRTIEFQSEDGSTLAVGMNVATRSSVLLNIYKGVTAAKAAGRTMEQVLNKSGLSFSGNVDAIGYSWYNMTGMPPTFYLTPNTFVVKTTEGHYAKFQPGTFYGPNSESFYMTFRYLYSGSSSGGFIW